MEPELIIADDDKMVVFLHKIIIKESGFSKEPFVAHNGADALSLIEDDCPKDKFLVFLDLNMPTMNGWEFLDELEKKSLTNCTKVAIVTSSIDEKDKRKAASYNNVIGFIEKPLEPGDCDRIKNMFL